MGGLNEYEDYDAIGLAELVRKGDVTPGELLDEACERVEERNPQINAIIYSLVDAARAEISAGLPDGPFRGVPFLMKDLHASVAGAPLTNGSKLFKDAIASHDSELVRRYRRA
ncbi:MAG: amidase, partial [Myxococcota bacterium]